MGDDPLRLAIGALTKRERSSSELADWLRKRGVMEQDVSATIDELIAIGELDDGRFARRYAEDKRELSGWGPERIQEALRARGISAAEAEAAAQQSSDQQLESAIASLERRSRGLDSEADRASALAYLTRRGFDYELAYEAVRTGERRAA